MSASGNSSAGALSHRRFLGALAAMVVSLIMLVGCAKAVNGSASIGDVTSAATTSSSATSSTSPSTSRSTTSTSPTTTSTSTSTSSSAHDPSTSDGSDTTTSFTGNPDNLPLTPKGTALKFGEPATLPISYAFNDAVVTFSDISLTKGVTADWATLGADTSDAQGEDPWYVKVTITQLAGGDMTYSNLDSDLSALTSGDDQANRMYLISDDNPLCPYASTDRNFAVGSSYTTCIVFSANTGDTVTKVVFEGSRYDSEYNDAPVVWSAG